MTAFIVTLADFICMEIQGFPFFLSEQSQPVKYTQEGECSSPESKVKHVYYGDTITLGDEILDPIDAIPENSLKHMLKLPKHFERIMCYSLSMFVDAMLFELTLMPIQAVSTFIYILQKGQGRIVALCDHHLTKLLALVNFSDNLLPPNAGSRHVTDIAGSEQTAYEWPRDLRSYYIGNDSYAKMEDGTIYPLDSDQGNDIISDLVDEINEDATTCHQSSPKDDVSPLNETSLQSPQNMVESFDVNVSRDPSFSFETKNDYTIFSRYNSLPYLINPSEACGFVRFIALILTVMMLSRIDTSKVYHNIRGQPFFKLYVILNMLEICERLCRSFGRDCTDTLMRTTMKIYKHLSNFNEIREAVISGMDVNRFQRTSDVLLSPNNTIHNSTFIENSSVDTDRGSIHFRGYDKVTPTTSCRELHETSPFSPLERNISLSPVLSPVAFPTHKHQLSKNMGCTSNMVTRHVEISSDLICRSNALMKDLPASMDTIPDTVFPESSTDPQEWRNMYLEFFLRFMLVAAYTLFHAFLHLVRVLIFNIAINSSDSAMFLLMVTNNFAEIKSTVFKKYNETSLFTIVSTDAVERIHLCFDAMIVFFKMSTVQNPFNAYLQVSRWLIQMLMLEILIDYFKHSFLLKFNKIEGEIFKRYTEVLMADVLLSRCQRRLHGLVKFDFRVTCKGAYSFSHIPARRLGLMPSPIVALIVCNIPYIRNSMTFSRFIGALLIWSSLFFLKITFSILVLAHGIKKRRNLLRLKQPMDKIGAL
ncbi:Protein TAPT1 -like protein [Babesia sp. Xinjiang]|uniref:Protein TAPT1 -like protein n=1 Tax=Babesia sp. Xinjiang TaxID=462227 RepID=UPI000A22AD86|nr:Protein TAPT1 -like protein [Babesia sp. Xinjiang]ORM40653.1 Protein TAPT1 -like protein [Babesia sp. Xinjiang]